MRSAIMLVVALSASTVDRRSLDVCSEIEGASIIADDGAFLGKLTDKYDSESILNEYGNYGSKYSTKSIWNEYGEYGGKYSDKSPFNPYTSTPPALVKRGKILAYLSVNKNVQYALNPYVVRSCEF